MNGEQEIITSVKEGDADRVRELIETDIFLADARDTDGTSALMTAIYHGREEIAQIILDSAPTLTIHEAAAAGLVDNVTELLEDDPSLLDSFAHDGWTALHLAAYFNREKVVRLLVERGANINLAAQHLGGLTPLHSALSSRNSKIAVFLLRNGASVSIAEQGGEQTPLHYAATNDMELAAQILLERGADPEARDAKGRRPVDVAREKGSERVVALLKDTPSS
jgi:ankyrin repeat protein